MTSRNAEVLKGLLISQHENKAVEFYDECAKDYDNAVAEDGYIKITEYAPEVLKQLFLEEHPDLQLENAYILDVGCGSGLIGTALQKSGFKVFDGIDASQGMLDVAEEKNIYRNLMKGKLTETEKFDLQDGTYDGLLCMGCIGPAHIDFALALQEFHRLLKKGGIAVYTISDVFDQVSMLEKHLKYFYNEQFVLLKVERSFYRKGRSCHLYSLMKK